MYNYECHRNITLIIHLPTSYYNVLLFVGNKMHFNANPPSSERQITAATTAGADSCGGAMCFFDKFKRIVKLLLSRLIIRPFSPRINYTHTILLHCSSDLGVYNFELTTIRLLYNSSYSSTPWWRIISKTCFKLFFLCL